MSASGFLAIDWGTSNFRGWRIGSTGRIEASVELPFGVSRLDPSQIPRRFEQEVRPALNGEDLPALMCGMVGSNIGWRAVDYVRCPASLADLARGVATLADGAAPVRVVPGLLDGAPDVMRGEETQIFGWLALHPECARGSHLVCHPGTHSKWARVEDGRIVRFVTAMTGELFDVLRRHSVIGRGTDAENEVEFSAGLDAAGGGDALSARLFATRARVVSGRASADAAPSYLSGVLIGSELGGLPRLIGARSGETVHLVGSPELRKRYAFALARLGWDFEEEEGDRAVIAGLRALVDQGALA
jgi:2-dehydro-3-deoxygalactonokinase